MAKDNSGDYPMGEKPSGRFWLRREREDHRHEVEVLKNRVAGISGGKIAAAYTLKDSLRFELGVTVAALASRGNLFSFGDEDNGDVHRVKEILEGLKGMKTA